MSAPSSDDVIDHSKGVQELYHISYFYLGVLGSFGTFFVGLLVAVIKKVIGKGGERPDERTLHRWFRQYDPYAVEENGISNKALSQEENDEQKTSTVTNPKQNHCISSMFQEKNLIY